MKTQTHLKHNVLHAMSLCAFHVEFYGTTVRSHVYILFPQLLIFSIDYTCEEYQVSILHDV